MQAKPYNRNEALAYTLTWALGRNPKYYNFTGIGGDCTNFASQVLYAGSKVMNPKPTLGWYYYDSNNRAPSWSGVAYFYNFLTSNKAQGPVGIDCDLEEIEPGDFIQLSEDGDKFVHTVIVLSTDYPINKDNILVAAHSFDTIGRPLSSYIHGYLRCLHITHVNM